MMWLIVIALAIVGAVVIVCSDGDDWPTGPG